MSALAALGWGLGLGFLLILIVVLIVYLAQKYDPSFYVAPDDEEHQWRP